MTEAPAEITTSNEVDVLVRARLDRLELDGQMSAQLAKDRFILAELKIEALRAGIVDLDGLKFLDFAQMRLAEDGSLVGGVDSITQLKRAKPWLFQSPSSSSMANVPPAGPTRQKLAKEMTVDEYRVARANIIRGSIA